MTDGGDTLQDFVLAPAPTRVVNGVVRDASGGGWPLYARIDVTAPGFTGATVFSDPLTGYYSINLVGGGVYQFAVSAIPAGYVAASVPVPVAGLLAGASAPIVQNIGLDADLQSCTAPGYVGPTVADFSSGTLPSGWSLKTFDSPWTVVSGPDPCGNYDGNLTGGSGAFAIITSDCDHGNADSQLRTPTINLSGAASARIEWHNDYHDLDSIADVDVSTDGGATWTNVWRRAGVDERGPGLQSVDLTALAAGQPSVEARFRYQAFFAYWWQVDDVSLGEPGATCHAQPGGLVVGTVRDANTGLGVNGATVVNLPHEAVATTFAPQGDPNAGDGFYILFAPSGDQPFEASLDRYTPQDRNVVVIPNAATHLDFSLAAGRLTASPSTLDAKVRPGDAVQKSLSLSNGGGRDAGFDDRRVRHSARRRLRFAGHFAPRPAIDRALERLAPSHAGPRHFDAVSAKNLPPLEGGAPDAPTLPAGRVLASYPSGIAYGWGLAFDTDANDFWISNIVAGNGDDRDYRYLADGSLTGDTIDDHPAVSIFAADGTYNSHTKTIWRVDAVGLGSSCIFELDPAAEALTGRTICPVTGTSERGLAYDPTTDTYYIGSWNDGVIKHFDSKGVVLDSGYVGVPISGLAFNPSTGHVFAMLNQPDHGHNVMVYDALHDYAVVGGFPITDDSGAVVLTGSGGAGMDADCEGNLWLIDQDSQTIYKVYSGEGGWCPTDIPWLSVTPLSGTVGAVKGGAATATVTATYDSTGLFPGLHQARLQIDTDTPYKVPPVGVNFTVEFLDVPEDSPAGTDPFENFIYGAAGALIMPGCDQNGFLFCPDATVDPRRHGRVRLEGGARRLHPAPGLQGHLRRREPVRPQRGLHPGRLRRRDHRGVPGARPASPILPVADDLASPDGSLRRESRSWLELHAAAVRGPLLRRAVSAEPRRARSPTGWSSCLPTASPPDATRPAIRPRTVRRARFVTSRWPSFSSRHSRSRICRETENRGGPEGSPRRICTFGIGSRQGGLLHDPIPPKVPRAHDRRARRSGRGRQGHRGARPRSAGHPRRRHAAGLRHRAAGRARDHGDDGRRGAEARARRDDGGGPGAAGRQLAENDGIDHGAADGAAQARARDDALPRDDLEPDDPGRRAGSRATTASSRARRCRDRCRRATRTSRSRPSRRCPTGSGRRRFRPSA